MDAAGVADDEGLAAEAHSDVRVTRGGGGRGAFACRSNHFISSLSLGRQVEEVEEEEETEDISKSKNIKMSTGAAKKAPAGKKK